jgi:hypothetical protein
MTGRGGARVLRWAAVAVVVTAVRVASAAPFAWKGHTWNVTSGAMVGVAMGSPANVSVDASGYLHLTIVNSGGTWTASELFTTDDLGFGTYQWQVDGPIDVYDKNVVLGLFPYGPAAGIGKDGTNEIDIEFSRWGQANGPNADWTDYPSTGTIQGELSFSFSLGGGTLSTSRFVWTSTSITDFLMTGLVPVGSTANLVKSWTYAPPNPTTNIPQQAMPLGINLWCYAIPSDGKDQEVVIRDFAFVQEGTPIPVDDGGVDMESGVSAEAGGARADAAVGSGTPMGSSEDAGAGAGATAEAGAEGGDGADPGAGSAAPASNNGGCGCSAAPIAAVPWVALAVPLALLRRRRRRT